MALPGPEFWRTVYGLDTYDEFFDKVGRYVPSATLFGIGLDRTAVAEAAYQSPAGAYGNMAIVIASVRVLTQPSDATLNQVNQQGSTALYSGGYYSMGQLIVPNCFQVSVEMVTGGRAVTNVIGVENASGTAAGAAAAVLAAWKVASGPLAVLSNLVAMTNVHAVDIGSSGGAIVDLADTTTGGISASNSLATRGACALIRWNGSTRNRSSRGRLYFGPIRESDINTDGATLNTGNQTTINTAFTNFRSSLASAGYPLVVLSRKDAAAYSVSSQATEATIATQRRRIRS